MEIRECTINDFKQIHLKILWQSLLMRHIEEKELARLYFVPLKIGRKLVIAAAFGLFRVLTGLVPMSFISDVDIQTESSKRILLNTSSNEYNSSNVKALS